MDSLGNTERPKDVWDKIQSLAPLVASILVPLAVAFVGSSYASAMKNSENQIKYVELAVSILRSEPTQAQGRRVAARPPFLGPRLLSR